MKLSRKIIFLASGLWLVAAFFFFRFNTSKQAPPVEEILRSQLEQKAGILFKTGSEHPFTGLMIEKFADGEMLSRTSISNGLLHGTSEGWFPGGQLQVRESFVAGVSHGLRSKWHSNGQKLSEAKVVQGQITGSFKKWDGLGNLSEELQMSNGVPHGLARAYYSTGTLKSELMLSNGVVVAQKFFKEGDAPPLASLNK